MNLRTTFSSIAEHCIFLSHDNQLYSWGETQDGALGLSVPPFSHSIPSPTLLPFPESPSNIVSFASGEHHSLALMKDGSWYGWGSNSSGQLGLALLAAYSKPTKAIHNRNIEGKFKKVRCGAWSSFGITEGGLLYSWGDNTHGQLGINHTRNSPSPCLVPLPGPVRDVASGWGHTMILLEDGQVFGCGKNNEGQLALPEEDHPSSFLPIFIPGLPEAAQITCGGNFTMAITKDRALWGWGYNGGRNIGLRSSADFIATPTCVINSGVFAVVCGNNFSVALLEGGLLHGWGFNGYGQIGLGHKLDVRRPMLINFGQNSEEARERFQNGSTATESGNFSGNFSGYIPSIHSLACTGNTTFLLTREGTMWAWGSSSSGQAAWRIQEQMYPTEL